MVNRYVKLYESFLPLHYFLPVVRMPVLSTDELTLLAADLVVLSDMLANLAARKSICEPAASAEDVP